MITRNLVFAIFCYGFIGIYTEIQLMMFSTLPGPLMNIYNYTLVNHYGIYADDAGLSMVSSLMTLGMAIGVLCATIFIIPKMDKKGRKFITVKMRFLTGAAGAVFQVLAGRLFSAECYFVAQIMVGISIPLQMVVTPLYMAECAPDLHRGAVSTTLFLGNVISASFVYFIGNPNMLGTIEKWPIIPAFSFLLAILLFALTYGLPESPKWLVGIGEEEKARESIQFYQGTDVDENEVLFSYIKEHNLTRQKKIPVIELCRDETLRQALKIIVAGTLFVAFSPQIVEGLYSVVIMTKLGLTVEQAMNVNLVVHLLFLPLRLYGTTLIDKFGRRAVLFLAAFLVYLKLVLMCTAQFLSVMGTYPMVTSYMAISNEVLSEFHGATGIAALHMLLVAELIPPAARVSVAQLSAFANMVSMLPLMIAFPVLNAVFPPLFYFPLLLIQPVIVLYLYRNLPETKERSVYDIVHELDEDVRSRANTRCSAFNEYSTLLPRKRFRTYSALL